MPGQKLRFGLAAGNMSTEIETARAEIQNQIASAGFRRFARQTQSAAADGKTWLPVAVLNPARLQALGFPPDTENSVRLSADTVRRHNKAPAMRFASFAAADWRRVQQMLDGEGWIVSPDEGGENTRFFWRVESRKPWKAWRAILKRSANGELYLKTLHRAHLRQVEKWEELQAAKYRAHLRQVEKWEELQAAKFKQKE